MRLEEIIRKDLNELDNKALNIFETIVDFEYTHNLELSDEMEALKEQLESIQESITNLQEEQGWI